jgi:hypothetical protein
MGKIRLFKTERMRKIKLAGSSNLTAAVFLVLALTVIITLLSNRHYLRWDMTLTGEHSLSEKTLQVLKTIEDPVTIKAFVQEELQGADQLKRLLGAYTYASPKITYEIIRS